MNVQHRGCGRPGRAHAVQRLHPRRRRRGGPHLELGPEPLPPHSSL